MSEALLLKVLRVPATVRDLTLVEWDMLLRQAAGAQLMPALVALVDDGHWVDAVPAPARAHLDWMRVRMKRHAGAVEFEVARIRAALADLGLPVLLLKGAAYSTAGVGPAHGRLFGDIDIMVPKAQLADVEAALMLHGWASNNHDAYDQRYYRRWMHEIPPLQHMKRHSVIDVHHAILPQTARVWPDPALLRAAAIDVPGMPGVQTLAPADMVLHSAVHLFYDGEFDKGLRDLVDLHRLLTQLGPAPGFWEYLPARAMQLQLARPLWYALRYSAALLGTVVPPATVAALVPAAPGGFLLPLMDGLFTRALQPMHHSCNETYTVVARTLLYIRGNWLRMPPLMLAQHLFHKAFISRRSKSP